MDLPVPSVIGQTKEKASHTTIKENQRPSTLRSSMFLYLWLWDFLVIWNRLMADAVAHQKRDLTWVYIYLDYKSLKKKTAKPIDRGRADESTTAKKRVHFSDEVSTVPKEIYVSGEQSQAPLSVVVSCSCKNTVTPMRISTAKNFPTFRIVFGTQVSSPYRVDVPCWPDCAHKSQPLRAPCQFLSSIHSRFFVRTGEQGTLEESFRSAFLPQNTR